MALIPTPSTDYTDKDFDALRVRLFALVQSVFPEWTDQNVANFGNILVELYAFVGDVLTYYQDNNGRESRIVTATQRKSLLGLCKLISYTPSTANAATADLTFSIPTTTAGNVNIPAGTVVKTAEVTDPVEFQTSAPGVIPTGSTSVIVASKNSEPAQDTFTSTGLADQELTLSSTPYLDDSAVVVAGNGAFTQTDNFLDSTSTDKHFTVVVDQNDRATVRFGDGTNGVIPTGTITIDYEVGGGTAGNVEAGTLAVLEGTWTDHLGNPVVLSVTNPLEVTDGVDRETNAQIKELAPLAAKTQLNSITRTDFETNALRVPGVSRCLANTSNEDASVPENTTILYPIPSGGGTPSSALKAAVLTMCTVTYPPTTTHKVQVLDPAYKTINVTATVYRASGYSKATVKAAAEAALAAFFAVEDSDGTPNENMDFGANMVDEEGVVEPEVRWSDAHNVVRDLAGVRKMDTATTGFLLNGARANVTIEPREFPQLGTVTLYDGDDGSTL
jgi:uncharacterized phage protein gp47/JayE